MVTSTVVKVPVATPEATVAVTVAVPRGVEDRVAKVATALPEELVIPSDPIIDPAVVVKATKASEIGW